MLHHFTINGPNITLTSQVHMAAMLVLFILENNNIQRWGVLSWDDVHTIFPENSANKWMDTEDTQIQLCSKPTFPYKIRKTG